MLLFIQPKDDTFCTVKHKRKSISKRGTIMHWYIQQSLERSEGDKGWRLTDGEWSQVLRPLMIAKEDVIITGGLNHLLRIFEICYTPESKETREEARRIARVKAAKTRRGRAPVKRQLIIDYLIAHPECKVREVMDACGVSQKYVYQTKKMLEG